MNTALIAPKTTKSTQGVAVMNLKKGQRITDAHIYQEDELQNPSRYRKKIPALGALPKGGQHTVRTMDCAARPGKTPLV